MLRDLTDYRVNSGWLQIIAAVIFLELIFIIVLRPVSRSLDIWYKRFGISAVIADVTIILIGFALARYIYTFMFREGKFENQSALLAFVVIMVCIQVTHDMLYWVFVKNIVGSSQNGIIQYMYGYGKSVGIYAILGDTTMVVTMSLLAAWLVHQPPHASILMLLIGIYGIPYAIS